MPKAPRNNIELVRQMMEYSASGALAQLVIVEAIRKYVDAVADMPIEEYRKVYGDNPFITADAWHAAATEIKQKADGFYNRHST